MSTVDETRRRPWCTPCLRARFSCSPFGRPTFASPSPAILVIFSIVFFYAPFDRTASFVMVNMALEAQPLETRVAALLVAIIVAPLAALLVALVFDDQAYLCAIAWALAAIADKSDFRRTTLPSAVADGVNRALSVLWVTLLVFGALVVLASKLWKEQGKCAAGDSEEKAGIASSKAKKSD